MELIGGKIVVKRGIKYNQEIEWRGEMSQVLVSSWVGTWNSTYTREAMGCHEILIKNLMKERFWRLFYFD